MSERFANHMLIIDIQELDAILADLGITQFAYEITGAFVDMDVAVDGEVTPGDVWLTESSNPWSIYAEWQRPKYFADDIPEELDLQD